MRPTQVSHDKPGTQTPSFQRWKSNMLGGWSLCDLMSAMTESSHYLATCCFAARSTVHVLGSCCWSIPAGHILISAGGFLLFWKWLWPSRPYFATADVRGRPESMKFHHRSIPLHISNLPHKVYGIQVVGFKANHCNKKRNHSIHLIECSLLSILKCILQSSGQ